MRKCAHQMGLWSPWRLSEAEHGVVPTVEIKGGQSWAWWHSTLNSSTPFKASLVYILNSSLGSYWDLFFLFFSFPFFLSFSFSFLSFFFLHVFLLLSLFLSFLFRKGKKKEKKTGERNVPRIQTGVVRAKPYKELTQCFLIINSEL